ncbi:cupin domain-containing protein [Paraburkholderia fungorum]|jgi:quercetin dioxygenase-like cupin family protein|uniref:AraC-like ligand binding domain protein n=1 Tax=Paraburkholderia fungorum TaxID=134537 RepID=A0AAJ3SQV2_9BURK|nr:cupin domain-containing protein [Paraburkholderia fungorum]AJZ59768.1 araC-like ligand binding domain protein [Paraburkholderia fungorum]MBB5544071.1 quercetin dioxygenase-like cupin family protein [Paraburkholderia fungorum]MBU7438705.1 cupin domain-containing protein [Paraburkholderia fungorum]MDT8841992.1 cupin domain-containing protein [Paraburkholderia fungorum]PNE58217.1 cupin domain-containing protein [Paraburkholderia fungorum]
MSERDRFSSVDFPRVPAVLEAQVPDKVVHRNVLGGNDAAFSAERQHPVALVDLPSRVLSMTIGGLKPGQTSRLHRHNYETLIYVTAGRGWSRIGSHRVEWQAGDALYVPVWAWHQHGNTGDQDATYVACENAPVLQSFGVALREEADAEETR